MEVAPGGGGAAPGEWFEVDASLEDVGEGAGEGVWCAVGLEAVDAVDEPLGDPASSGDQGHAAARDGLERDQPKRLALERGKCEEVILPVGLQELSLGEHTLQDHVAGKIELADHVGERRLEQVT